MKKYIVLSLVALMAATGVRAQGLGGLAAEVAPVEAGRELPRTRIVSYSSDELAVARGAAPSLWFQPLSEGWSASEGQGFTTWSNRFRVPFEWLGREFFVRIGATGGPTVVAVNGREAGYVQNGFASAEFDITPFSREGVNEITITVYGNGASVTIENFGTPANGEHDARPADEVFILSQPRIRIRDFTVATTNLAGGNATVELGVVLKSHLLNDKQVRVYYTLLDPEGATAAYSHRDVDIGMRHEDTVRFFVNVPDAKLWSHETPNLYTLVLKTMHEGRYTEYVSWRVGLGTVAMDDGRLLVNGHGTPFSVADWSAAGDSAAMESALREIKGGGYNMVRVDQVPQSEYFYDLCDRLGLYVCDLTPVDTHLAGESRGRGGNPSNDPAWAAAYRDRALSTWHSSRNHPSVVMYSLAANSANGVNLYESFLALKAVEKRLPIVYFASEGEWNNDALPVPREAAAAVGRISFVAAKDPSVTRESTVTLAPSPGEPARWVVTNESFLTTERVAVAYTVRQGMRKVGEGTIPVMVGPKSSATVDIPTTGARPGRAATFDVRLVR